MRPEQIVSIIRDVILFIVGVGGIVYQLITGEVNFALLAVFTAMTGVPGLTNMISLLRGGLGTVSPSSLPAPEHSESDSQK